MATPAWQGVKYMLGSTAARGFQVSVPAGAAAQQLLIPPVAQRLLIASSAASQFRKPRGPGPTIDPSTGTTIGRFIADNRGNVMAEPEGGSTVSYPPNTVGANDTHTLYPNGSNFQRLNPKGHGKNLRPHGHGHLMGTGPGKKGQGPSVAALPDKDGNPVVVDWDSDEAHWPAK